LIERNRAITLPLYESPLYKSPLYKSPLHGSLYESAAAQNRRDLNSPILGITHSAHSIEKLSAAHAAAPMLPV
jgi:hypothetical protein